MELIVPKDSQIYVGAGTLFPQKVQRSIEGEIEGETYRLDVHLAFGIINRKDNPYEDVNRAELRKASKPRIVETPTAENKSAVPTPTAATPSPPTFTRQSYSNFRKFTNSDQVQSKLQGIEQEFVNRVGENEKDLKWQKSKKIRRIATAATRFFNNAYTKKDDNFLRTIPSDMKLGKNEKTMEQMGLKDFLGVEFYTLQSSKPTKFNICNQEDHKWPAFLDLNIRSVADAYSPQDNRVYVFGRGLAAELAVYNKRISVLQGKLGKEENQHCKTTLEKEMEQLATARTHKRRRFYQSAAQFLANVFGYIALSDLSASALKKQPNIGTKTKRDLGTVAIEEFRKLVLAASAALTPRNRAACNYYCNEDNSTKTLQCCKLGAPLVRWAKTVVCPFGCKDHQGKPAAQERDGASGRNQAAGCYNTPPSKVLYKFAKQRDKSTAGDTLLDHFRAFEETLGSQLLQDIQCEWDYDPSNQGHTRLVERVRGKLNEAYRSLYTIKRSSICFTSYQTKKKPTNQQQEIPEGFQVMERDPVSSREREM
jgi:hypothetical protein